MSQRVVFDTNVWLSGLLWRGNAYQCLVLARAGIVQPAYCLPMLAELSEKLRDPFGFPENHVHAVIYELRRIGHAVQITGELHVVADDPDDDMFVECAAVSGATLIVSSDHHLLDLEQYEAIRIVSPAAFLKIVAAE